MPLVYWKLLNKSVKSVKLKWMTNEHRKEEKIHGQISCRTGSAYRAHYMKLKRQALQDVVLRKLRDGLDDRGISLHDCLKKSRGGPKAVLTIADFTKVSILLLVKSFHTVSFLDTNVFIVRQY